MPRSIKLALAGGIIAAAIAPSINAHTAQMPCNGTVTTHGSGPATIYTDERQALPAINYWIYLETNGHAGLQSGGNHVVAPPEVDYDNCINTLGDHGSRAKDALLL